MNFVIFSQFLYNKVDFTAFEAVQLQIEVQQKMLGRSVTLGVNSVEKRPKRGTLKNLTTSNLDININI